MDKKDYTKILAELQRDAFSSEVRELAAKVVSDSLGDYTLRINDCNGVLHYETKVNPPLILVSFNCRF